MKKKIIYILSILVMLIIILIITIHFSIYSTATKKSSFLNSTEMASDTIKIAYIGDSWAYLHRTHNCIIDTIISSRKHLHTQMRSAGVNGMTSKEIYQAIFNNDSINNILKWGPNYCIISAGINDTDLKIGKRNYQKNMKLIIEFMHESNVTPIIIQIPHYDIGFSFKRRHNWKKMQRLLSMIITGSDMDCIDSYRTEFEKILHLYNDKIIYVKENEWNPKGYQNPRKLYTNDKMHLNEEGYYILDSCIANHICNHLSKKLINHKDYNK